MNGVKKPLQNWMQNQNSSQIRMHLRIQEERFQSKIEVSLPDELRYQEAKKLTKRRRWQRMRMMQ
jgi:aspartate carbamoyltransferase catalytic subunit